MQESSGLKVVSWNINGIRTINIKEILENLNSAIVAVQETKISRDQLDEQLAIIDGYNSYFSFCRKRSGYSGVATYCRDDSTPVKSEEGLTDSLKTKYSRSHEDDVGNYGEVSDSEKSLVAQGDDEGRCVITQHTVQLPTGDKKLLAVINVYCPRLRDDVTDTVNNKDFKLAFHNVLGKRANALVDAGSFVMLVGDFNISHKIIDRCEAAETGAFVQNEFRQWMDDLLEKDFKDTYRLLHPTQSDAFTCWCTQTNARQNNYGSRIDYIVVDKNLSEFLESATIHSDVFGSDHCPISATFHSLTLIPEQKPSSICTKYFPEYSGKQTKLIGFLKKGKTSEENGNTQEEIGSISEQNSSLSCASKLSSENTSSIKKSSNPNLKKKRGQLSMAKNQPTITNFFTKRQKLETEENGTTLGKTEGIKNSSESPLENKISILDCNGGPPYPEKAGGKTEVNVALASETSIDEGAKEIGADTSSETTRKAEGAGGGDNKESCAASALETVRKEEDYGDGKEKSSSSSSKPNVDIEMEWQKLMSTQYLPICTGHKEPCALKTVRKKGLNKGRKFWACSKGVGKNNDPNGNCNFFMWATNTKS